MRLHPAVATAAVVMGGLLVLLAASAWLQYAAVATAPPSGRLIGVSVMTGTFGAGLVFVALVLSLEPRPRPPGGGVQ